MKLLLSILLIFQTTISLNASVKYFKNYYINFLNYEIVGIDSLTEDQALKTICNKFTYDRSGKLVSIEGVGFGLNFYDKQEKVAKIKFTYTENSIIKKFYDIDDKPITNKKYNVFGEEIINRENGYTIYFLDKNGNRTTNYLNVYSIAYLVNKNKKLIELQFRDENNNPLRNKLGAYKTQLRYNDKNQLIEKRYFDEDGKLTENKYNYAIIRYRYNNKGKISEKRYFDANNKPTLAYPYNISYGKRVNERIKVFNDKNEPVSVLYVSSRVLLAPDTVNYDLVVKLTTQDLKLNIISTAAQQANSFSKKIDIKRSIINSMLTEYYRRTHARLNRLAKKGKIFQDGKKFYLFSSDGNEIPIAEKVATVPDDSARRVLRRLFLLSDTVSYNYLDNFSDPAARICYGALKVNEIIFFQWDDILFCVNPYYERLGGSRRDYIEKVAVDFKKLPLNKNINHVFFEGVTVNNFCPRTYYGNTKFYFSHCIVTPGYSFYLKFFVGPEETVSRQLIYYKNAEFTFNGCSFDTLALFLASGDSKWPRRHFPSFNHHFYKCDIKNAVVKCGKYIKIPITRPVFNNIDFIGCNIDELSMAGVFTSLVFDNTKVKEFFSSNITKIENELKFINSSFESPLNFPRLILADTATFQMINTSYQGYIKFPWKEIKGKIRLTVGKDRLKAYGSLYNLLKANYKQFSLIREADESYFYWKQFERKNFWRYYWQEPATHWYNPFDVAKAIGLMIFNNINYFSCGYGVKPLWIFPFTIFIVSFFALIYFFMPTQISNLEEHLIAKDKIANKLRKMDINEIKELFKNDDFNFEISKQSLIEDILSSISTNELLEKLKLKPKTRYNLSFFWYCFYFSFSTFTTIGIGDWYPAGKINKALVMLEGALGWLCLGLFITTYANILLR